MLHGVTIDRGRNAYLDRIWGESAVPTAPVGASPTPNAEGTQPGVSGLITTQPPPLQVFPWWLYEGPGAQDWYAKALNFTAVGNATTVVPGFSYIVNTNNVAVIKTLTMTVQQSTAAINLTMTLLLNGAPISGWNGIAFPPILATGISRGFSGMIVRLPENGVLTAQFTEVGGTNWTCSFDASGWQVSKPEVARLQGSVNY